MGQKRERISVDATSVGVSACPETGLPAILVITPCDALDVDVCNVAVLSTDNAMDFAKTLLEIVARRLEVEEQACELAQRAFDFDQHSERCACEECFANAERSVKSAMEE